MQDLKPVVSKDKEDDKGESRKDRSANVTAEDNRGKATEQEDETHKAIESKGRNIDLQLDLEKPERDESAGVNASGNKATQKQQQQQMPIKATKEEPLTEKSCKFFWPVIFLTGSILIWMFDGLGLRIFESLSHSSFSCCLGHPTSSLPLPMSMASWPGGLPPMGYGRVDYCV